MKAAQVLQHRVDSPRLYKASYTQTYTCSSRRKTQAQNVSRSRLNKGLTI